MNRRVQCKSSENSITDARFPALLTMRGLGTLILAIIGIIAFASSAQPAGPGLGPAQQ